MLAATRPAYDQQQLVGPGLGYHDAGALELFGQAGQMLRKVRGQLPLKLDQTAPLGRRWIVSSRNVSVTPNS